jgi:hypothetical protein
VTRLRIRRAIGPAVLVLVIVLLLLPLLMGRSFWLRDILLYTYPMKAYLRERLASGELALWNPRLGLGRPFAGLVQPGVFYPLDVVMLLPFPRGLDAFFALHAFIAGFGMRAWLRARGGDGDDVAATFGGALFALSGYYVSMLIGNGSYAVGAAWIPWALAAVSDPRLARGAAVARLGLAVALMILGGDPHAAWLTGALIVVEAVALPSERRRAALVVVAGGLALAVALAAVQIGPALEVAAVGRPGGVPLAEALHFSFPPVRLWELIQPGAFADRIHRLYDEGTGLDYEPWAAGIYVGLATPFLAIAAARRDRALAAVAVVALLIAFGRHAPFFTPFFKLVPGARLFRYPEKYLLVTTITVCALAARGLPLVAARPRRALVVGGALLVALAAARAWSPLAIAAATLAPLAFASFGQSAAARRWSPRAVPVALAAIVVADLLTQSMRLTDWVPSSLYREIPPPIAAARALAGPGLLRLYRPQYLSFEDVDAAPPVVARATLRPNVGVENGIAPLDAYDNFDMVHEAALWAALTPRPLRLLEVTSTRFALVPPSLFAGREGFVQRAAWPALHAILAEATHVPPRAYLAAAVRIADDTTAAHLLQAPDFAPGRTIVLAPGDGARDLRSDGNCTLEDDRPEHQRLRCHAAAPSYAVISDAWFPGWHATVDGAAAPILRANLAMRAIPVPAGDSLVELRYRPRGLVTGAVVSLLALLAALALALTGRAYRPPSPAAPGSPPSPPDRNTARSPASPNPQTPTTPAAPG